MRDLEHATGVERFAWEKPTRTPGVEGYIIRDIAIGKLQ